MAIAPPRLVVAAIMVLVAASALVGAGSDERLVDAARRADVQAVRTLVRGGRDVDRPDADGTTALHWAVHRNDVEMADLLIAAGAKVSATNRYGVAPIVLAAANGSAAMIRSLLRGGADAKAAMPDGDTALMAAARSGRVDAIDTLIAHGADVHAAESQYGQTALMWAAAEGNALAILALVAAGARVDARSTSEQGFTPLLFAVRSGSVDSVPALLDAGANVNETLAGGMSALVLATVNARYDVAELLLKRGADPNASAQGWAALHQLTWTRRPSTSVVFPGPVPRDQLDSLAFAERLLSYGANPNARLTREPDYAYISHYALNHLGATPFLLASFRLDLPLMKALLAHGADPLLPNADGTTPLMAAAGVGFFTDGENPYTPEEAIEGVKMLLDLGSDPNAADGDGDTPLHGAAYRGVNEVVRMLLAAGARLDVRNRPDVRKRPGGEPSRRERRLAEHAAADGGWTPWRIASGVTDIYGLRQKPDTAALIRRMMEERGLWNDEMEREARLPK